MTLHYIQKGGMDSSSENTYTQTPRYIHTEEGGVDGSSENTHTQTPRLASLHHGIHPRESPWVLLLVTIIKQA